ncbi:MAG: hypothetical protein O7C59_11260 [Rickettsia endosymbiont of Ixodes persulcatus]|nr:hypothetical protein [Rickettsia endosymbiont of Ixodes persulcatus]
MSNNCENQLISLYEEVLNFKHKLCLHIHSDLQDLPIWSKEGANNSNLNREKVILALGNFNFTPGLSPQETFKYPAVIAGTVTTLHLIKEVNEVKTAFKNLVRLIQQEIDGDASKFVRNLLAHAGHPGIKLKQVFRHIASISYHPRRIAWTQGKHTSSKLLSKQTSEEMLIKAGQGEHIEVQRDKLNRLGNNIKLIKHRRIKPIWVVNIGSFKENKRSKYEDIRTSLPIFYVHNQQLPEPIVSFNNNKIITRKIRSDKRIESLPILPSISVYRYKMNK